MMILAFLFTMVWKLSCGISINCTFETTEYALVGNNIYHCNASILMEIDMNKEKITAVYGEHQSGRNSADVLGLFINNGHMEYFPTNIEQFFPNIKALRFPSNSISTVNNQHLIPFPNLMYLDLRRNKLTSVDSNLFSGLEAMRSINFGNNNIKHVGHDFILPNTVTISFLENPCINSTANTQDAITALRFSLLVHCPPSISQIEDILESRPNWLTNVNIQVQSLVNRTDAVEQRYSELNDEVKNNTNELADLQQSNLQLTTEMTVLQQSNVKLTNELTELTDEMTDLQENNLQLTNEVIDLREGNMELTNRNSQLETKIGFVDTRAGYLEVRVAVLEAIIERRLGVRIDEAISENDN